MEKLQTKSILSNAASVTFKQPNNQNKAFPADFLTRFFIVLSGNGNIVSKHSKRNISKGDFVAASAFTDHEIVNVAEGDLEILSLTSTQKDRPALPESMLITTAPPTPNGPLHLGHASGPYMGADLLGRYLKKKGISTKNVFYTNDHQTYVLAKADDLASNVDDVAKQFREQIILGLKNLGIVPDELLDVRNNSLYKLKAQLLFEKLLAKGVIKLVDSTLPYCLHCQEILVDAFLSGECPHCSSATAGSCEDCGHYHTPDLIESAHCAKCKIKAHARNVKVARLNLEDSRAFLEDFVEKTHMNLKLREKLREILKTQLPNLIITHPGNYGISTQHPQLLGQVFHVWFEMAAGLDFIRIKDQKSDWAHFFGMDNAFFYGIAIPAILEAYQYDYAHPTHLFSNEFLELDGKKISKSKKHVLWLNEELERFGRDFLRLSLNYQSPQNSRSSINFEQLIAEKEKISAQLDRMLALAKLVKDAPAVRLAQLSNEEKDFYSSVQLRIREVEESLHPLYFNRRAAVRAVLRLMLEIEDFRKDFMRTKNASPLVNTSLKALGQVMSIIAPDFSQAISQAISFSEEWDIM